MKPRNHGNMAPGENKTTLHTYGGGGRGVSAHCQTGQWDAAVALERKIIRSEYSASILFNPPIE